MLGIKNLQIHVVEYMVRFQKKDECTLCIQSAVLVRYTVPLQYQSQISTSILYYKPKACSLSLAHS